MIARSFWGAKANKGSPESSSASADDSPVDSLLDARFDDDGRLAEPDTAAKPRAGASGGPAVDELDLAVQKLSEGLEAIERQSRAAAAPAPEPEEPEEEMSGAGAEFGGGERDFVAHSLDRLEARLEALSRRLQQRGGASAAAATPRPFGAPKERVRPAPIDADEDADIAAQLAESRRLAEAEEAAAHARRAEAEEAVAQARKAEAGALAAREAEASADERRRQAILADARRHAEAIEARRQAELADVRRQAELAEAKRDAADAEVRRQNDLTEARRAAEAAEKRRQADLAEARKQAEAAEVRRHAEVAEAQRQAEAAEERRVAEAEAAAEKLRRQAEEAAEERQRMAAEAAEERRRVVEEAEAVRLADLTEARRQTEAAEARRRAEMEAAKREAEAAEARRRSEMEEARRRAEIAAAQREAELAAAIESQFTEIEARIDGLQRGLDENQVEPVRADLLEIVEDMSELSRSGRATGEALNAISSRLDETDMKLNAARNMAGNRLGDIQDRLGTLVERLDAVEIEIPGFDAVRENQSAILERFDRMEGMVNRLASTEDLLERVEGLKRQLQTSAQQREVARIEELVLKLADRLDAMPAELSDEEALARIETQLGAIATDLTEARRQRKSVALAFDDQLADISEKLREVGETGRTPDLSGIERQLAEITGGFAEDRRATSDALARLDRRLGVIAAQIEAQEDDTTSEVLAGLTEKMDSLAAAISAQDASGARRDIDGIDQKLDQVAEQIAAQAERLSRRQIEPLEQRLEEMQAQFVQIQKRAQDTSALFKPLVQKLHEISGRLAGIESIEEGIAGLAARTTDPRGVHTQLEAILSRLEVLKGRSVDPARMNELFDRIEFAIRTLPDQRGAASDDGDGVAADRLARLEMKLDDVAATVARGGEAIAQDDFGELRADIASLRRELRSMPAPAQDEPNLGELMRAIAKRLERTQEMPAALASLEGQIERLARVLDDPESGVAGLAGIQASLKTIEKRLDDTRRSLGYRPPREVGDEASEEEKESVAGFARALSEDAAPLKGLPPAPEQTKDPIEAVQDTLEAVVKRMAFLERDADATAVETRSEKPAEPEPPEPAAAPAPAAAPEPSSTSTGGLLSRFTSRQLLRRATGGRAESFSPEAEEAEESSDLPLEPGTDSPLHSSLTGAPSSDTQFMSGARKARTARARIGEDAGADETAVIDDDFLAAARRAARAATAEVGEGEAADGTEPRAAGRARKRGLIAVGLLAAAVVIAAVVIARTEVWPYPQIVAFVDEMRAPPAPSTPAVETAAAPAPAPALDAPLPPPAEPTELVAAPPPAPPTPAMPAGELRPDQPETAATAAAIPETTAPPPATPSASTPAAPPSAEMAPVVPAETPAMPAAPSVTPPTGADVAALPEAIGPAKLHDAALAGDPIASFEVAARYAEGRNVLPDMPTAVRWYERSADAGLAPAQYRLGSIYEKGLGVPRDLAKAQDWYRRAAEAGNVKAMHNLAVLYAEGAGGEPDLERAAVLFRNAAEHGVRDSQFNLAILHARGLGVPQDLVEAYKWFAVAASSGDEESAKRRDIIGQALPEADRTKAEQMAAAFQPLPLVSEANEVQMPDWRAGDDATSVEVKSDNEIVALVQKLLAENGYDPGPPDGLLGEKTIEAISEFQGKAGLPRTGQIDTELVAALQNRST